MKKSIILSLIVLMSLSACSRGSKPLIEGKWGLNKTFADANKIAYEYGDYMSFHIKDKELLETFNMYEFEEGMSLEMMYDLELDETLRRNVWTLYQLNIMDNISFNLIKQMKEYAFVVKDKPETSRIYLSIETKKLEKKNIDFITHSVSEFLGDIAYFNDPEFEGMYIDYEDSKMYQHLEDTYSKGIINAFESFYKESDVEDIAEIFTNIQLNPVRFTGDAYQEDFIKEDQYLDIIYHILFETSSIPRGNHFEMRFVRDVMQEMAEIYLDGEISLDNMVYVPELGYFAKTKDGMNLINVPIYESMQSNQLYLWQIITGKYNPDYNQSKYQEIIDKIIVFDKVGI